VPRVAIPVKTRSAVALMSRRRCCICYGLHKDSEPKAGQFAHLDHDATNNDPDNLAYLCLLHHDQYDGRTSQSAAISMYEVTLYREELYKFIQEQADAFRSEVKTTRKALDYWTFRKGPSKSEIDAALEFFAGPHRTKSVLLMLDESQKCMADLLAGIPGVPDWVESIVEGLVTSRLVLSPSKAEQRYRLAPAGERLLRILDAIPDFIKNAAWDANWRAYEQGRD